MKKIAIGISFALASLLANADSLTTAPGLSSPIAITGFDGSPFTAVNPVNFVQLGSIKTTTAGMIEAVYLGNESDHNNLFNVKFGFGPTLVESNTIGTSIETFYGANTALDFFFRDLTDGSLGNNGSNNVGILYKASLLPTYDYLGPFDFLVGFNDSGRRSGDADFDDFVVGLRYKPSAVPVPAAVWLMGSVMMGFAGIRRRKLLA